MENPIQGIFTIFHSDYQHYITISFKLFSVFLITRFFLFQESSTQKNFRHKNCRSYQKPDSNWQRFPGMYEHSKFVGLYYKTINISSIISRTIYFVGKYFKYFVNQSRASGSHDLSC